jgi:hypothetical protein
MATSLLENTEETQKHEEKFLEEKVRPDLNLEKWSIWQPAKSKSQPKERVIRREIELPNGDRVLAEVEVGFTNKGVLTTEDQKTLYALLKIWEDKGKANDPTFYSLRKLSKILKKRWGTNVINATSQSLLRLRITPLIWKNSYLDSTEKNYVEVLDPFNILSELKIIRRKDNEQHTTQEFGYFKFNDFILRNILNGHTKPVMLDTVLSFRSEIAQLLYTHIDLIMARRDHYERKTRELFFDDLGLEGKAYNNASNRKQKLMPALKELHGVRLSTGYITSITLERTKDGKDYKIVVDKDEQQQLPLIAEIAPDTDESREVQSVETQRPTTLGKQARDLVACFHKLFHGAELSHPSSKAINQATALVAQHGYDLACFIVEFAHTEAPKTKYSPQTFGGILQYTARALATHDEARAKEKARTTIDQCTFCDRNSFTFFEDERGSTVAARCPHDLDTIKALAEARNWHHPKLSLTTTLDLQPTPTL